MKQPATKTMAKGKPLSESSLSSVITMKSIIGSIGLAFLLNQAFVFVQQNYGPLKAGSGLIAQQRLKLAELQAKHDQLLSSATEVAQGYNKLYSIAKDHVQNNQMKFDNMDEHFMPYFGVEAAHHLVIDPVIQKYVDKHDVTKDQYYIEEQDEMAARIMRFAPWIERGTSLDRRFYVKYADKFRGYGLFANAHIRKGDILGEYTGMLTNRTFTTDYTWTYYSDLHDEHGNRIDVGIDAKEKGNWFRFVNAGPPEALNCEVYYVPYNNVWHVIYVATKPIRKDEEFIVSYGESYWASRKLASDQPIPEAEFTDFSSINEKAQAVLAGGF